MNVETKQVKLSALKLNPDNPRRIGEHLTPLSRGGKNKQFNLVYSCKSCNSTKRQKTLEDFAIETGRIWLLDKWESIFAYAYGKTQEAECNTAR